GRILLEPAAARRDALCAGGAAAASDGSVQRWRRAFAANASLRAAGDGEARGRGAGLRALLYGRARHAAREWHRVYPGTRAEDARDRRGADCVGRGTLLRDGPRQAVGTCGAGVWRDGAGRL